MPERDDYNFSGLLMRQIAASMLLAATLGSASEIAVKHRPPRLASIFPQGSERGKTLALEARGENLDRAQDVVFLTPGIEGRLTEATHTRLSLEFTVSSDAAWGPHYFRIVGPRGASSLGLFRVGDQVHRTETEPNGHLDSCHGIEIPVTLNGRLDHARDIDIFRIRVEAGEHWIFDVRSARNGSGLDPSMILLDRDGRKLRHSEDHFIWDPFFSHEFESGGDHFVVLQPTRGRANPDHGYQLDIHQGPFLSGLAPVALPAGTESFVSVHGAGLSAAPVDVEFSDEGFSEHVVQAGRDQLRLRVLVPADARAGMHWLALSSSKGRSNKARFWVPSLPSGSEGAALAIPSGFSGIARYRSPDRFPFRASAGETVAFEIRAHRLGVPVDMKLEILSGGEGQTEGESVSIAENDDARLPGTRFNKDPVIVHTFEDSGQYELLARSLTDVDGHGLPYFLEARRPMPRMELLLDTDRLHVFDGLEARIRLTAFRLDGFNESATVSVEGLSTGFEADPVLIPPVEQDGSADGSQGQKVEIALRASDLPHGSHAQARIVSSVDGSIAWKSVRIASGGGEGATDGRVDSATVVVTERPEFSLEVQRNTVNLVRGGSAAVPVHLERRENFASELSFRAENLPPGVLLEPSTAGLAPSPITLTLKARSDARTGTFTHVTILGADSEGRTEQAPPFTLIVD